MIPEEVIKNMKNRKPRIIAVIFASLVACGITIIFGLFTLHLQDWWLASPRQDTIETITRVDIQLEILIHSTIIIASAITIVNFFFFLHTIWFLISDIRGTKYQLEIAMWDRITELEKTVKKLQAERQEKNETS